MHIALGRRAVVLAAVVLFSSLLFAGASRPASGAATGLVGAWSFDRPGATVPDASGNGNTATVVGADWTSNGRFGGGLNFNGTSDYVTVPDSPSLDLLTGMTVEAWVRPTQVDQLWHSVLMKEQSGMLAYSLYGSTGSGAPSGEIYTGADAEARGASSLPANTWTHLAATYDGTNLRLFVNGVRVATTAATGSLVVSNGVLRIGGNSIWGEWFSGSIDEVRVYNRALTAAQLQADMGDPISGLVGAWSFDQSGSTVPDASGNGNTGTVSGATWTSAGKFGGALTFDGASSSVVVPDSPSLDLGAGMTLEAWVRPDVSDAAWRTVLMKEQPNMLVYALYGSTGSQAPSGEIYLSSPADVTATGSSALPAAWTHLAETYDGSTLRLYVNGAEVASTAGAGSILTSTGDLRIGGNSIWGEYFDGRIDEVRIYDAALSAPQIQTDMLTGLETQTSGGGGTPPPPDTTAPSAPGGLAKTSSTPTTIGLSWSPSTDNVGVTGYGLYRNGSAAGSSSGTTASIAGLACGTSYTLAVDAYDAAGNRSGKSSITASTSACTDSTPPTAPSGLAQSGSTQTSVTLSWNASTDAGGVAGYGVYKNGTIAGTTASTSYTISGLACGTSTTVAVDAYDAAGNRSGQTVGSAKTAACPGGGSANLYLTPGGSDSNPCTQSAPCRSWDRGYRLAQPGQTVQIGAGTYAGQTLGVDSSKLNAAADVTLITSGTVSLTGDLQILGSHVYVKGPISAGNHNKLLIDSISMPQRTHNVTVEGFDGEDFVVGPASYVTIKGGDFGPSVGCQDGGEYENKISASSALPGVAPDHVTIDGASLHDADTVNSVSCHNGGLNIVGGTFLTIRNSKFFKNMVYDIEFDDFTGSFPLHDVTIENNWFDAPTGASDGVGGCQSGVNCKGEADVQIKWNGVAAQNWLVRFNSFANGFAPEWGGAPPSYSNFRIVANAGGNSWDGGKWMACRPAGKSGVTIGYNAWLGFDNMGSAPSTAKCGSTDVSLGSPVNYVMSALPYVNPSVTSPDFHLKAGTAAQGIVTPTTSDYSLATDMDGNPRPAGARDAGADQH
jgi:chitodextrinase